MNYQTSKWLNWAREIFSLSQSGITYSGNPYDIERYKRLQEITAEIIASQAEIPKEAVLDSSRRKNSPDPGKSGWKMGDAWRVGRSGKYACLRGRTRGMGGERFSREG
jgi:hypothetical protein